MLIAASECIEAPPRECAVPGFLPVGEIQRIPNFSGRDEFLWANVAANRGYDVTLLCADLTEAELKRRACGQIDPCVNLRLVAGADGTNWRINPETIRRLGQIMGSKGGVLILSPFQRFRAPYYLTRLEGLRHDYDCTIALVNKNRRG